MSSTVDTYVEAMTDALGGVTDAFLDLTSPFTRPLQVATDTASFGVKAAAVAGVVLPLAAIGAVAYVLTDPDSASIVDRVTRAARVRVG